MGDLTTYLVIKGKQCRDNIHSEDVARFIDCFLENPRRGEVYNLGGGKPKQLLYLRAFGIAKIFGKKQRYEYSETESNRRS